MAKKNPTNERAKLEYFEMLKQADGKSESTIRAIASSILRFEEFTGFADFKTFGQKQATGFKDHLAKQDLAAATILSTLNALKRFMRWLAIKPGYKSRIRQDDIAYLNLSEKDVRAASAPAERPYPSLPMIEQVIAKMPSGSAIEKRDRALIAFTAITGIRDGALVSLRVKHFDANRMLILQNPKEVATKFSKRIDTFLFPLNEQFESIALEWLRFLRDELLFADDHPLFPKTLVRQDENDHFEAAGLDRQPWANAAPVRAIFQEAFRAAGLPEFTPHSFRKTIVSEMYRRSLSVAECKAWSQNLGHEGAMTTLTSYGKIGLEEQGRLVRTPVNRSAYHQPLTASKLEEILAKHGL